MQEPVPNELWLDLQAMDRLREKLEHTQIYRPDGRWIGYGSGDRRRTRRVNPLRDS